MRHEDFDEFRPGDRVRVTWRDVNLPKVTEGRVHQGGPGLVFVLVTDDGMAHTWLPRVVESVERVR